MTNFSSPLMNPKEIDVPYLHLVCSNGNFKRILWVQLDSKLFQPDPSSFMPLMCPYIFIDFSWQFLVEL